MAVAERQIRPDIQEAVFVVKECSGEQVPLMSVHERFGLGLDTNCQTNWSFRDGKFIRQSETSHRIGRGITSERAEELGKGRDLVVFEEVENPVLCFGCKEKELSGKFLTVSWFSWVGKKGERSVEQLTFFLHGITREQAEQIPQELLAHQEFLPQLYGEDDVSIKENIDLLIPKNDWFLQTFNMILTDLQKSEPINNILLEQTKGLETRRHYVHSGEFKKFETKPKLIWITVDGKKEARLADFDNIKQCWVKRRETTNDPLVLAGIEKSEALITLNWKPGKSMVLRAGMGLSARTAGRFEEKILQAGPDLDAISNLFIDGSGNAKEISEFVPRIIENEIYKQGPVDVTSEYFSRSIHTESLSAFPILPFNPDGVYFRKNKEVSMEAFVLGLAAPATFGFLGETINHLPLADFAATEFSLTEAPKITIDSPDNTIYAEQNDLVLFEDLETPPGLEDNQTDMVSPNDFPVPPPEPLPEPTGGGGLVLPREIKVMVWDQRMEERFKQAQKPETVFEDKVLPQEVKQEQVIFDALKKEEVKFKEYASDLEVIENLKVEQVEKVAQVVQVGQGDVATLLLANSLDKTTQVESCDKNLHVHEFVTDNNKKHNNSNDEVVNSDHYDTAPYHSKENVKDELPEQIEIIESVVQEPLKKVQPEKFFIPNALLTNYLLWREMFKDGQPTENSQPDIKKEKMEEDGLDVIGTHNTSFATKIEQHKTQAKKVKVKTNPAFLSLLLLTKIKLLTKVKILARKNNLAGFKQLFITDTLLLFLLNPKLFLVNESVILGSNSDSRIDSGQARMT